MSEFKWNGRFQYKLKLINGRQSSSDKKHNISLRLVLFFLFRCCFAGSPEFSLSTVKQTKLFHPISEMFFTFLTRKKFFEKNFSPRMCAKRRLASCKEMREFWRETHTPLWLLIGRVVFLTREKTSFAILIGRIIFFTCENHSSLLWLVRTHLLIKIYNTTFWWVFLRK